VRRRRERAVGVGAGEAEAAHFGGADAGFQVEGAGECLARKLVWRDVRQQAAGVDVDGVAAGREDNRDAAREQGVGEPGGRVGAVGEVGGVCDLEEALRECLEVAPGETAVGGKAFGRDQQLLAAAGEFGIAKRDQAADIGEPILFQARPRSAPKSTFPPENWPRLKSTSPPENWAPKPSPLPKWTVPPEKKALTKSTVPPENSAP
jgi:hypothetical protein